MAKPDNKKSQSRKREKPSFEKFVIKYGWAVIILMAFLMYERTLGYALTQLDDYIFIVEKGDFNKNFGNIFKSFVIGVFGEKDVYYRPLFLVTFVLEERIAALFNSYAVYHFTNMALHIGCLLVLYRFLKQINIKPVPAMLLTLFFGLHPVLTMAVAWIPGRNDLLLTLFALLFFKSILSYARTQQTKYFVQQCILLLLAFFTKETAVFLPLIAFWLYWLFGKQGNLTGTNPESVVPQPKPVNYSRYALILISWAALATCWYFMRLQGLDKKYSGDVIQTITENTMERLPAYLLYLGKVFIPVNLSVFPSVSNGQLVYGFVSVGIIAALTILTVVFNNKSGRKTNYSIMAFGLLWFVIFILPFFFVPKEINDQVFEHRLYLPLIGLLIFLSHTFLFNGELKEKPLLAGSAVVFVSFFVISNFYIKNFKGELVFWQNAVASSPHSSYAQKLLGARLMDAGTKEEKAGNAQEAARFKEEGLTHFKEAYRLNKKEKHARYFIVRDVLIPKDSLDKAETLLREEIEINPTYTEAYFELSHVFFMKGHIDSTFKYLIKARAFQPGDEIINNNLLSTYIQLKDYRGAKEQVNYMNQHRLKVKQEILNMVENIPH